MFSESPNHTLQATELVHEAYLRLVNSSQNQPWNSRGHFFAAAAEAMRRILVERARQKSSLKRGGNLRQIEMADFEQCQLPPVIDLIALDEALNKLQQKDPRKAELVKLRFFVGLTIQEAAKLLDISNSTADNDWAYAKSWLRVEMSCDEF
jgi:RNA polymerase sigma factor (TIGR02999 family)